MLYLYWNILFFTRGCMWFYLQLLFYTVNKNMANTGQYGWSITFYYSYCPYNTTKVLWSYFIYPIFVTFLSTIKVVNVNDLWLLKWNNDRFRYFAKVYSRPFWSFSKILLRLQNWIARYIFKEHEVHKSDYLVTPDHPSEILDIFDILVFPSTSGRVLCLRLSVWPK